MDVLGFIPQFQNMDKVTNTNYVMNLTDDKSEIRGILTQSLKQSVLYNQLLHDCVQKRDWKNLSFHSHTYKSSARIIGASQLQLQLDFLEKAANTGDEEYILALYWPLVQLFKSVESELSTVLKELDTL